MLFMSQEHVEAMNALLMPSEPVRAACALLPGPRVMRYDLADGPDGQTVHWTMTFDHTVQFGLTRTEPVDVVLLGDWAQMIRASRANRQGEQIDPGIRLEGDESVLAEVAPALEAARLVATIPADFPAV